MEKNNDLHSPYYGLDLTKPYNDPINHPSHYASGKIECWDAMRAARGDASHIEYCIQTAIKYLYRCGKKGNRLEDMKKAEAFLNRAIKIEAKEI